MTWPVLGERTLVHPATAAALGEAEARAWLLDGEAALAAARAARPGPPSTTPGRCSPRACSRPTRSTCSTAPTRRRRSSRRRRARPSRTPPRRWSARGRAWPRAAARPRRRPSRTRARAEALRARGPSSRPPPTGRAPPAGTPPRAAALGRARRALLAGRRRRARGPERLDGAGSHPRRPRRPGGRGGLRRRAAASGPGSWQLDALRAALEPPGPARGRLALRALERAARQELRQVDRAVDVVAAVRALGLGDPGAHGPEAAAAQLDRASELARELPIRLELALLLDERLSRLPLDPTRRAAAAARLRERRALLEQVTPLRALARREAGVQLQDPATPGHLAELLRLDPANATSYRDYYTVRGQFVPGGFDAQALALELEPLKTLWDLGYEADRLTRDSGLVGQMVHGAALADHEREDAALPLGRDDDLRRGLGAVHAVELRKALDAPARLGALDAAERLARRRPATLAAWLLLGRARLELGHDPHGALEALLLARTLPEPFEDLQPSWGTVPLFHAAEAHAAAGAWDAACAALEEAAALGWRATERARRSRHLGRDPAPRPLEELLRRVEGGE
ncbi:MAG: hypothetical protein M9894_34035 [Planctomycetes bacterium]|nr:hypothetical protein [Planctomycetota bacterium]